jgi:predicted aspartyl protease
MGRVEARIRVSNPAAREQPQELVLMVDTGATFTVVPADLWRRLRLASEFTRHLRTADGRLLERGQGNAYVEIDGLAGVVPVVQGDDTDLPVLGVTTLEILGLAVDPVKQTLVPSEHLYL